MRLAQKDRVRFVQGVKYIYPMNLSEDFGKGFLVHA